MSEPAEATCTECEPVEITCTENVYTEICRLAAEQGLTVTELVKRSLALHGFMHDRCRAGARLLMQQGDDIRSIELR